MHSSPVGSASAQSFKCRLYESREKMSASSILGWLYRLIHGNMPKYGSFKFSVKERKREREREREISDILLQAWMHEAAFWLFILTEAHIRLPEALLCSLVYSV